MLVDSVGLDPARFLGLVYANRLKARRLQLSIFLITSSTVARASRAMTERLGFAIGRSTMAS